ncbi:MAG: hypothetical protein Q9163_005314, partial [Psora crenata]
MAERTDSDTISLTSTISSDHLGDYEVDKIVAERELHGAKQWLVAWLGYSWREYSWEPRHHFNSQQTLDDWRDTQMRIVRGEEKPFNVTRWEKEMTGIGEAKRLRRNRRQQKRKKAGWRVPDFSSAPAVDHSVDDIPDNSKMQVQTNKLKSQASSAGVTYDLPWTDDEARALEAGLQRVGGPFMDRILALYGVHGQDDQPLQNRSVLSLQAKALEMKMGFVNRGRKPPDYLEAVAGSEHRRSPGPTNISNPLQKKQGTHLRKPSTSKKDSQLTQNLPMSKDMFQVPSPHSQYRPESCAQSVRQSPKQGQSSPKQYTGTAGPPDTVGPRPSTQIPVGKVGSDSAHQPGRKPVSSDLERMKSIAETDVACKWNGKPQKRKRRDSTVKLAGSYTNVSHRNNIYKRRRNEPSPDADKLVLIDPKTGKAPKSSQVIPACSLGMHIPTQKPCQPDRITSTIEQPLTPGDRKSQERADSTTVAGCVESLHPMGAVKDGEQNKGKGVAGVPPARGTLNSPRKSRKTSPALPSHSPPPTAPAALRRPSTYDSGGLPKDSMTAPPQASAPADDLSLSDSISGNALGIQSRGQIRTASLVTTAKANTPIPFSLMNKLPLRQNEDLSQNHQLNHVTGNILTGSNRKSLGRVKFCGLAKEQQRLLLNTKSPDGRRDVYLKMLCTAMDYKEYFHQLEEGARDILSSGYIVPYQDTFEAIERLNATLVHRLAGALFFSANFTMLVWPVGSVVWQFLDRCLPEVPADAALRFAVRTPIATNQSEKMLLEVAKYADENPGWCEETLGEIKDIPQVDNNKPINAIFTDLYRINYNRLTMGNNPKDPTKKDSFFLCFVPVAQEPWEEDPISRQRTRERISAEHDYFVKFLQENGAKEIYSMQSVRSVEIRTEGAWEDFRRNVKDGCIVTKFHNDFTRHDQLVGLAKILHHQSINAFMFSMKPIDTTPPGRHLIRLFPSGGCLLITDSLFLRRPREALRILRWFRLHVLVERFPGSWKVAMRPRPIAWMEQMLDHLKDGYPRIYQLYADICSEIIMILFCGPRGALVEENDMDVPNANAPIICPNVLKDFDQSVGCRVETNSFIDDKAIVENDDILVKWFAETSMTLFEVFRGFHIIPGYDGGGNKVHSYWKRWTDRYAHCDVLTAEDLYKLLNIEDSFTLQKQEDERISGIRAELAARKASADKAERERLETTARALRQVMHSAREQGYDEETVRYLSAYFREQLGGYTEEEIQRLEILDAGGEVVTPAEEGNCA